MQMVEHPASAAGCNKAEVNAFEAIASGTTSPRCHSVTLDRLMRLGLVDYEDKIVGKDRLGTIKKRSFFVPIPVHIQWCQWCSEQQENADV
jgi:hypothetical protein